MNDEDFTDLLSAYGAGEPSAALRERIVAAAPGQRAVGRAWRWTAGLALGLGMAGSCAAGVAAGFTLAPHSVTRVIIGPTNSVGETSALADPAGDPADS